MKAFIRARRYGNGFLAWSSLYMQPSADVPDKEAFKHEDTANLRMFQNRHNLAELVRDTRTAVLDMPGFGQCVDEFHLSLKRPDNGRWERQPVLVKNRITDEWRPIPVEIYDQTQAQTAREVVPA